LSGVDRNSSRALRVAFSDGLRLLPTEPGRESPVHGSYRGRDLRDMSTLVMRRDLASLLRFAR